MKTHAMTFLMAQYINSILLGTHTKTSCFSSTMTSSVAMPSSSSSKSSSSPAAPSVIDRVAGIPFVAWSIYQVSSTLEQNRFTSSPYATAKGLSASAYTSASTYAEPLQVRLAPALSLVNGYAHKACDVVEGIPYVNTKPEEVAKIVHERRQSAADFFEQRRLGANKTIDEKVKTPAFSVACQVDKVRALFFLRPNCASIHQSRSALHARR
jgi:hypothetical protein